MISKRSSKTIFLLLGILFFWLLFTYHELIGEFSNYIFSILKRDQYDALTTKGSLVLGIIFLSFSSYLIFHRANKIINSGYLILTLIMMIISYNLLFVINIEMIHFVEYSLLAAVLFFYFESFSRTVFYTGLLGIVDETYQYFVTYHNRLEYLDFNDFVINILGAACGALILKLILNSKKEKIALRLLAYDLLVLFSILTITIILVKTNYISFYKNETAKIILNWQANPSFYTMITETKKFHVIKPFFGILIVNFLFLFYFTYDILIYYEEYRKKRIVKKNAK